jgi:hypothetical protein
MLYIYETIKESLNSVDHEFHKYQQNKQSPLILTEYKNNTTYNVGIPGPVLGQTYKCGGIKPVNGISTLPS